MTEEVLIPARPTRKAFAWLKPQSPFEAFLLATLLALGIGSTGLSIALGGIIDANLTHAEELKLKQKRIEADQSFEAATPEQMGVRVE